MILKLYLGFLISWTAVSAAQSPQAGSNAAASDQLRLQWQFDTKG